MWKFEREEQKFEIVPVGTHRLRIESAEKAVSRNGKDMIILKLDVSGYSSQIWHYIVFLDDAPQITNRNLTQLFDSFGIEDGDFNLKHWEGKVGAGMIKHEEYDGESKPKVNYFIHKKKQADLPAWVEGRTERPKLEPVGSEDDLPF